MGAPDRDARARRTQVGVRRLTPVHPEPTPAGFRIIVPLGMRSEWARNVIAAGHCRLLLHDQVFDLDEPAMVDAGAGCALPLGRVLAALGFQYLNLRTFASHPGCLEMEEGDPLNADASNAERYPPSRETRRRSSPIVLPGPSHPNPRRTPGRPWQLGRRRSADRLRCLGRVAQLVERQPSKLHVASSSLVSRSIPRPHLAARADSGRVGYAANFSCSMKALRSAPRFIPFRSRITTAP